MNLCLHSASHTAQEAVFLRVRSSVRNDDFVSFIMLLLTYERPPHPDAVTCTVEDELLEFIVERLSAPPLQQQRQAADLRQKLAQQNDLSPFDRPAIPCRRNNGLFIELPWRSAKWLMHALDADGDAVTILADRLCLRLESDSITPRHYCGMPLEEDSGATNG